MEYSEKSLRTVIETKAETFGRNVNEPMNSLEFFVSLNLLCDITECLNYMHVPMKRIYDNPISDKIGTEFDLNKLANDPRTGQLTVQMHRDVKPDNILVSIHGYNDKFVKLCDWFDQDR